MKANGTSGGPGLAVASGLGPRIPRARATGRRSLADVAARTDLTKGNTLSTLRSETEVRFVLEGAIDLVIEGETIRIGAGESVTFGAGAPHTWRNASPTVGARILWILAPTLPDPQSAG